MTTKPNGTRHNPVCRKNQVAFTKFGSPKTNSHVVVFVYRLDSAFCLLSCTSQQLFFSCFRLHFQLNDANSVRVTIGIVIKCFLEKKFCRRRKKRTDTYCKTNKHTQPQQIYLLKRCRSRSWFFPFRLFVNGFFICFVQFMPWYRYLCTMHMCVRVALLIQRTLQIICRTI